MPGFKLSEAAKVLESAPQSQGSGGNPYLSEIGWDDTEKKQPEFIPGISKLPPDKIKPLYEPKLLDYKPENDPLKSGLERLPEQKLNIKTDQTVSSKLDAAIPKLRPSNDIFGSRILNVLDNTRLSDKDKVLQIAKAIDLEQGAKTPIEAGKSKEVPDMTNTNAFWDAEKENNKSQKVAQSILEAYNTNPENINNILNEQGLFTLKTGRLEDVGDIPGFPTETPDGNRAWASINRGSARLGSWAARTPSMIAETASLPYNILARYTGLPEAVSPDWLKNNPIASYYDNQIEAWSNYADINEVKVVENIRNKNYRDALSNLGLMTLETIPLTLALMVGGYASAASKATAMASGIVTPPSTLAGMAGQAGKTLLPMALPVAAGKKQELDINHSGMSEFMKTYNAWVSGTGEAVSEQMSLGTIGLGRVAYSMLNDVGKEAFEKALKESVFKTIYNRLGKNEILTGSLGEGSTELMAAIMENFTDKFTGVDPDRKILDWDDIDEFLVGTVAGGGMIAPAHIARVVSRKVEERNFNIQVNEYADLMTEMVINKQSGEVVTAQDRKGQLFHVLEGANGTLVIANKETGETTIVLEKDVEVVETLSPEDFRQSIIDQAKQTRSQQNMIEATDEVIEEEEVAAGVKPHKKGDIIDFRGVAMEVQQVSPEVVMASPVDGDPITDAIEIPIEELNAPFDPVTKETKTEEIPTEKSFQLGDTELKYYERADGSSFIPVEEGMDINSMMEVINNEVDLEQFDIVPITDEMPVENAPAWSKNKTKTVTLGISIVPKVQKNINPEIEAKREKLIQKLEYSKDVEKARSGDKETIKRFLKFGLDYAKTTIRRFVSKGEVDSLLSGERQMGRFKNGKVDVTSQENVTTAATSEYRITFNDTFDFNNGGKAVIKNEDLGDGNLKDGYTIDDVLKIEKMNDDGGYTTIYEGKNKTIEQEVNAELAALEQGNLPNSEVVPEKTPEKEITSLDTALAVLKDSQGFEDFRSQISDLEWLAVDEKYNPKGELSDEETYESAINDVMGEKPGKVEVEKVDEVKAEKADHTKENKQWVKNETPYLSFEGDVSVLETQKQLAEDIIDFLDNLPEVTKKTNIDDSTEGGVKGRFNNTNVGNFLGDENSTVSNQDDVDRVKDLAEQFREAIENEINLRADMPEPEGKFVYGRNAYDSFDQMLKELRKLDPNKLPITWDFQVMKAVDQIKSEQKKSEPKAEKKREPKKEVPEKLSEEQRDKLHNNLIQKLKEHNKIPKSHSNKRSESYKSVSNLVNQLGYSIGQRNGRVHAYNDGVPIKLIKQKPDKQSIDSHPILTDYTAEEQQWINTVIETSPDLVGVYMPIISSKERISAIKNIQAGKRTSAANNVLDELVDMFSKGELTVYDTKSGRKAGVSIEEVFKMRDEIIAEKNSDESDNYSYLDYEFLYEQGLITKNERDETVRHIESEIELERKAEADLMAELYSNEESSTEEDRGTGQGQEVTPAKPEVKKEEPQAKKEEKPAPKKFAGDLLKPEAKTPKLTDIQQQELDKALKEIDEKLESKRKALADAKKARENKFNELRDRNGLFGDVMDQPGKMIDGEFVFTDETVKKALKPFDENIVKAEKDIKELEKLRKDTINSAGQQKAMEFGEKKEAEPKQENTEPVQKLEDFGEKIGGARKDMGITRTVRDTDSLPAWRRKYSFARPDGSMVIGEKVDTSKPFIVQWAKEDSSWMGKRTTYRPVTAIDSGSTKIFNSEAEAEAYIPIYEVWKQRFRVSKSGDKYAITKSSSTGKVVEYAMFPTEQEATVYLYSTEGATSLLNHKREDFSIPALDKVERTGKNWRKGKDITTDEFMNAFGFRGGEFGNWVKPEERRVMLNAAYDSFMDLAELLNIPPKALSLGGELSIAFGARGKSKAAAHFEPGRAVINLTRMNGAGSLAHEWAHAVDNYFGIQGAKKDYSRNEKGEVIAGRTMRTEAGILSTQGMRKELSDLFDAIVNATQEKSVTRKMGVDEKQSGFDKMKKNVQREADDLVKKFENGVRRYKYNRKTKKREETVIKATPEQIKKLNTILDKILSGKGTKPKWEHIPGSKGHFEYSYISPETLAINELHKEVFGNNGLKRDGGGFYNLAYYMDKMYATKAVLDKALAGDSETLTVPTDYMKNSKVFDRSRAIPYWQTKVEMFARAFEYYIQEKLNGNKQRADYLQYDKAPVYDAVYGINPYPSGEERTTLNDLFTRFFDTLQTREEGDNVTMFRKGIISSGIDSRRSELGLYSTVQKAIDNLTQSKGTPQQMKAMLLKNGAKEAEMEWMEFDSQFANQKSVTKEDLQEWFDGNKIEVREVVKGEVKETLIPESEWKSELITDDIPFTLEYGGDWVDEDGNLHLFDDSGESYVNSFVRDNKDFFTDEFINRLKNDTKFSQYQQPGGENYREVLLTMPAVKRSMSFSEYLKSYRERFPQSDSTNEDVREYYNRGVNVPEQGKLTTKSEGFMSSHFEEPNIVVHVRMNDRVTKDGKRILFLEEVQSDWAQKGKKEGFKADDSELTKELENLKNEYAYLERVAIEKKIDTGKSTEELIATDPEFVEQGKRAKYVNSRIKEINKELIDKMNAVPDMPFKSTPQWVGLAMKRMLMYAAENGYDGISWTTGETQAERYDLSKQIDRVEYKAKPKPFKEAEQTYELDVYDKENKAVIRENAVTVDQISDILGKEIASKIQNGEGNAPLPGKNLPTYLTGLDLKVGGEGMKGFYDTIIPSWVNKNLKKYGIQSGETQIDVKPDVTEEGIDLISGEINEAPKDKYAKVHFIPITDQIREVVPEGMPMFRLIGNPFKKPKTAGELLNKHRLSNQQIKTIGNKLRVLAIKSKARVNVIDRQRQLPESLQKEIGDAVAHGVYKGGVSYLILENMESERDAILTFLHEVGVHMGIRNLIPNIDDRIKFFDKVFKDIGLEEIKKVVPGAYIQDWSAGLIKDHALGEEYMAFLIEKKGDPDALLTKQEQSIWDKFIAKINEILNKIFNFDVKITEQDVLNIATAAIQSNFQDGQSNTSDGRTVYQGVSEGQTGQDSNQEGSTKPGVRFAGDLLNQPMRKVIGEKGAQALDKAEEATVRMDNLNVAREMETAGKDAKAIKMATGWERGADKLWRYETPDPKPKRHVPENIFNDAVKAHNTIKELNEKQDYGTNRNAPISAIQMLYKTIGASMFDRDISKQVNKALNANDKSLLPLNTMAGNIERINDLKGVVLLSEVIDDNELFTAYPKLKTLRITLDDLSDYRGSYNRSNNVITLSSKLLNDKRGMESVLLHEVQHAIQDMEGFAKGTNLTEATESLRIELYNFTEANPEFKELYQELEDAFNLTDKTKSSEASKKADALSEKLKKENKQLLDKFYNLYTNVTNKPFEVYQRAAGEVESRNVQTRMNMPPKQRRETLLSETEDVAREDQIFLQDNLGEVRSEVMPEESDLRLKRVEKDESSLLEDFTPPEPATYKRMKKGVLDDFREAITNSKITIQRFQEKIIELGGKITDFTDVHSIENLYHGKVFERMTDGDKDLVKPMTKASAMFMKNAKISKEQVAKYLMTKHTPERTETFIQKEVDKFTKQYNTDPSQLDMFPGEGDLDSQIKALRESLQDKIYTGFTVNEANEYVPTIEDRITDKKIIDDLWNSINNATNEVLENWLKHGRIDKETYDYFKGRWKYYVPLRGWEINEDTGVFDYEKSVGDVISSMAIAKGRITKADDPLPYIVNMLNSSIIEGEKNEVSQAAARLIAQNLDVLGDMAGLTVVYKVDTGKVNEDGSVLYDEWVERPPQKYWDENKVKVKHDNPTKYKKPPSHAKEHIVEFYMNGQKYAMWFQDNDLAKAISNKNHKEMMKFISWLAGGWTWKFHDAKKLFIYGEKKDRILRFPGIGQFTRFMSANFTSRNPNFLIVNPVRDIPLAMLTQFVEGSAMDAPMLLEYLAIAQPVLYRNLKGKLDMSNKYDKWFEEWRLGGGRTGIVHAQDIDTIRRKIEKQVRLYTREDSRGHKYLTSPLGAIKGLAEAFEVMSGWSEDMTRFAVYVKSREDGKTHQRSLIASKNSSVNFNKKGVYSGLFGALWAFFNAGVQGTVKIAQLHKVDMKKMVLAQTFLIAQGYLSALLYDLWDGDDDDDDLNYDNIPDYEKHKNLLIPGTGVKVPMPHILRFYHALGVMGYDAMKKVNAGTITKEKAMSELILKALAEFPSDMSPWDFGSTINKEGKLTIRPLVPTFYMPFYDLQTNEKFTRRAIYKEPFTRADKKHLAKSKMYFDNVNPGLIKLTEKWYELNGGDVAGFQRSWKDGKSKEVPVWGDVNPAWIEHLAISYFGGMGTFFNDVYSTGSQIIDGGNEFMANKDAAEAVKNIDLKNVPMVQRFIIRPYKDEERENWYVEKEVAEKYSRLLNQYKKVGSWEKYEQMMSEYDNSKFSLFEAYDGLINDVSDRIKETEGNIAKGKVLRKELNQRIKEVDNSKDKAALEEELNLHIKEMDSNNKTVEAQKKERSMYIREYLKELDEINKQFDK